MVQREEGGREEDQDGACMGEGAIGGNLGPGTRGSWSGGRRTRGTCREIGPGGRGGDRGGLLAVRDSHHVVGFGLVGFGGGGGGREVGVRAVEAPENERERERGEAGAREREADESEEEEGDSLRPLHAWRGEKKKPRGGGNATPPPHGKGDSC